MKHQIDIPIKENENIKKIYDEKALLIQNMHLDQFKLIKLEYQESVKQMLKDYQLKIEDNEKKHRDEMQKLKDFYEKIMNEMKEEMRLVQNQIKIELNEKDKEKLTSIIEYREKVYHEAEEILVSEKFKIKEKSEEERKKQIKTIITKISEEHSKEIVDFKKTIHNLEVKTNQMQKRNNELENQIDILQKEITIKSLSITEKDQFGYTKNVQGMNKEFSIYTIDFELKTEIKTTKEFEKKNSFTIENNMNEIEINSFSKEKSISTINYFDKLKTFLDFEECRLKAEKIISHQLHIIKELQSNEKFYKSQIDEYIKIINQN